jgi:hypothetical protein
MPSHTGIDTSSILSHVHAIALFAQAIGQQAAIVCTVINYQNAQAFGKHRVQNHGNIFSLYCRFSIEIGSLENKKPRNQRFFFGKQSIDKEKTCPE